MSSIQNKNEEVIQPKKKKYSEKNKKREKNEENRSKKKTDPKAKKNKLGESTTDNLSEENQEENVSKESDDEKKKEKPNFELSGLLAKETNTYKGILLKYAEPEEARKPTKHWRLYVFKGEENIDVLHIHRCSAFLLGRERKVADIPLDHPSCSLQHAVIQYRLRGARQENQIYPYLIDLESSNGSMINGKKIEPRRYYELKENDVIKFGFSSRDFVLMLDD